jgi:phosphatidylserine/phosphatidylglycerophosphate/cardiolipin synthase-like enzyme
MKRLDPSDRTRIERVIAAHLPELARARGFVAARPGFPVVDGRLVREPAILVYLREKRPPEELTMRELLPREIDGIRVDVVQAGPRVEREMLGDREAGVAARAIVPYEPLPGDPIDLPFTVDQPLLCHVGPDTGWVVLRDFLAGSRQGLTAAMYDFNAEYIATTLIDVAEQQGVGITLTLDDDVRTDEGSIQQRLRDRLAAEYDSEIVVCRQGRRFPSAYHEKVAVRDGASFWLSSGNWSRSSQPLIDPIGDPPSAQGLFSKGNREWHIIVDHGPLAEVFARYIRHDRDKARLDAALAVEERARPDVFVRIEDLVAEPEAALAVAAPVPPQRLPAAPRAIEVRPLLSPDNYAKRVTELIRSAQRRLYLQYSYIHFTDAPQNRPFTEVLLYLGELSQRTDFDLRVIVNSRESEETARELAENGWNEAVIRGQGRVHNKGIVADGERVLISSQNWSSDGFLRNRDAGLIVHDAEIASYYEAVFLADWDLRSQSAFNGGPRAMLAPENEPTPPGMVRMSWRDYYGD